jgi:hypothetical protein
MSSAAASHLADPRWSAKWDAAAEDILSWIMTLAGIVPSELEK